MRTTPPSRRPQPPKEPEPFINIEAEKVVVGCMLTDSSTIEKALLCLHPSALHYPRHATIYTALAKQFRRAQIRPEPIDMITTVTELRTMGQLHEVGGIAYLTALEDCVPCVQNFGAYLAAVIESAQYRAIYQGADVLRLAACSEDGKKWDHASAAAVPVRMHPPPKLVATLRHLADRIEKIGEGKSIPDVKKFLAEGK